MPEKHPIKKSETKKEETTKKSSSKQKGDLKSNYLWKVN